jgi:hypothetical protein
MRVCRARVAPTADIRMQSTFFRAACRFALAPFV